MGARSLQSDGYQPAQWGVFEQFGRQEPGQHPAYVGDHLVRMGKVVPGSMMRRGVVFLVRFAAMRTSTGGGPPQFAGGRRFAERHACDLQANSRDWPDPLFSEG